MPRWSRRVVAGSHAWAAGMQLPGNRPELNWLYNGTTQREGLMEDDELSSSVNWSYIRRIQDLAFKAECGGDVIDELWQLVDDACVQACSLN